MVIVETLAGDAHTARGSIRIAGASHRVTFHSAQRLGAGLEEALTLVALPAAMRKAVPLVVDGPVSPLLLDRLTTVQQILHCWDRELEPVEVRAASPRRTVATRRAEREMVAFTGGVDSFHAALERPGAELLFVHGLDVPLAADDLREKVAGGLRRAAEDLGRPLLEMETDLRDVIDRHLAWNLGFGIALAACAHLLSGAIGHFWIAAGASYARLIPDGANPILTPLLGSESLSVRTAGCEVQRVEKVALIAAHPVVRRTLRVCWENRGGAYNCGRCEKCLRTMAELEICGALDGIATFAEPLDLARLARTTPRPEVEFHTRESLEAARQRGADRRLVRALESSLARAARRDKRLRRARLLARLRTGVRSLVRRLLPVAGSSSGGG